MTTAELLAALASEYPNGVSFDPMAVRLLRQKVPFEDWQIEDVKSAMFQLGGGLWFCCEMISGDESRLALEEQAREWLGEHGCFSVERLFEDFCGVLRHIPTPEACSIFLRHLGFMVGGLEKGGHFCFRPPYNLDEGLAATSEMIASWLREVDGTLTFHEIEQAMPHLTAEALESIRAQFMMDVHVAEVGGMPCWCSTEAIQLPEDFSEKLTAAVDSLVALEERLSVANLEFALNLFYRIRFREEYALTDNDTFMRVCAKHYHGANDIFPNMRKPRVRAHDSSAPGTRVRSPNTLFRNLGVPVGAELTFTKGSLTCVVLDDFNQVEYDGRAWAISALAVHLLGVSSANGFYHFSYEGETLWERRLRLEREGKQDEDHAGELPQSSGASGTRVRSPNTRFRNLGVPIGSELILEKDGLTCVVLDDYNQVEYEGKAWAISPLAMHLLGVSSANGFRHFSYEGETLWERRLRLEREGKQDEYQAEEMPWPAEEQQAEGTIIGLEGRPLSSNSWRLFRSNGTNLRVREWARRVENGESVENIASESGLSVSTVKQYIRHCHLYFLICEKNGIAPEDGVDV